MFDAFPRDFGKVNQAVGAVNVDEGTKISQAGYASGADGANGKFVEQSVFERLAGLVERFTFRENQTTAGTVNFDNVDLNRFTNELAPAFFGGVARGTTSQADL